jgi:hypothetical protein
MIILIITKKNVEYGDNNYATSTLTKEGFTWLQGTQVLENVRQLEMKRKDLLDA